MQNTRQVLGDARLLLEHDRVEASVNRADYDAFAGFESEAAADLLADVERFPDAVEDMLQDAR
jgi:uncharacterized protein (UPF0332 family)